MERIDGSTSVARAALRFLVALCAAAAGAAQADGPAPGAMVDRFDTVVIDAGHGGHDQGARGPGGTLEKHVVLAVARELAAALQGQGLRVIETRPQDVYVGLEERTQIANSARADLFLSVHANAAAKPHARGIETFFMALEASDADAQRLAERENEAFGAEAQLGLPGADPLAAILGDLIANEHLQESQAFARIAHQHLTGATDADARGVKQAPFVVLAHTQMPASLVEIGFITNPSEERQIASPNGRRTIVSALLRAVAEYRRRHDTLHGFASTQSPPPRIQEFLASE